MKYIFMSSKPTKTGLYIEPIKTKHGTIFIQVQTEREKMRAKTSVFNDDFQQRFNAFINKILQNV